MCTTYPRKSAVFADSSIALCRCTLLFCSLFQFPLGKQSFQYVSGETGTYTLSHQDRTLQWSYENWYFQVDKPMHPTKAICESKMQYQKHCATFSLIVTPVTFLDFTPATGKGKIIPLTTVKRIILSLPVAGVGKSSKVTNSYANLYPFLIYVHLIIKLLLSYS